MINRLLKTLKGEPITFMFLKTWEFSAGNRKSVLLFLFLFLCANIIELLFPMIFGLLLNQIQMNGVHQDNIFSLLFTLALLPFLSLVFWLFHGPARILERKNAFFAKNNYQKFLLGQVLFQKLSWHSERDSGDTIDKVNNSTDGLFTYAENIYNFENIIISILGTIVAITFFSWYVTVFLLFFLPVSIFIMILFDKTLIPQYKSLNLFKNKISAKIFDSLSNITSVIILKINTTIFKGIKDYIEKPFPLFYKNIILNEKKWFTVNIFVESIYLLPIGFYIYYNYSLGNVIEVGTLTALFLYLQKITGVFFNFAGNYEKAVQQKTDILNAEEIENMEIQSNVSFQDIKNWGNIRIKRLDFSYIPDSPTLSLRNLSFKRGEKIAVIGESGSGKTTFLKLIHGLYDSANSEICIDNTVLKTNFSDINIHSMLVPQEPELFSSTIWENITFGMDFSEEKVNEVLRVSNSLGVISVLPNGINSVVNEKGVNLSGGQKQRIALARALLFAEEKELILLDESTSSVDPENEEQIYNNIFQKYTDKTIIASIHKMNLLKYFDTLYIFESGTMVDSGSFTELLQKNEKFKEDWERFIAAQ